MALVSLGDQTFWSLIGKTKFSSHWTPASVSLFLTHGSTKITCLAYVLKSCWSIGVGILPKPVHLEGRSSLFVSPQIPHRYAIIIIDCIIIIIIKSSYNHRNMSPTYFRASQYEAMITYFQQNSCNCCLLCMKCHFHFIQSVCMSCCHLELHLFLVTFSNEFLLHGSKIPENVVTISLIWRQFRECENCWLWIATLLNSFVEVGTPGPKSLATPLFGSNI